MLEQIINKHYSNYENQSVENIKRDAKGLLHIISDYEGRVVFELLQNAFDRADHKIAIIIKDNILYVANDGKKFSYSVDFDYEKGLNKSRGDFQSICSVYTSTKTVSNSIGNKGIGFKSVFSIAKNQDEDAKYPTRFVELYTKGLIGEEGNSTQEVECGFKLFEMIRSGAWLKPIAHKVDVEGLSQKIVNAQKEYAETGLPGYYFPIEISTEQEIIQDLFAQNFVTIVSIPLEDKERTENLIRKGLVNNGIHFQFIQIKYSKEFEVTIKIDNEQLASKTVKLENKFLFYQTLDQQELKALAVKAGIEIENISIGVYLREDNKGMFYNYLPTEVKSPFPFVDFHADFRTTINRKNINFDSDDGVGAYNNALLKACIELLFTIWKPENLALNCKYISTLYQTEIPDWNIKYFEPAFNIESVETQILISILGIKTAQWDLYFGNLTNYLAYNISGNSQFYSNDVYQYLYDTILKLCFTITNDYKLSAWSRVEGFMQNLRTSFELYDVNILPGLKLKDNKEIFYRKEEGDESSILPVYFTSVEFQHDKLRKVLNVKNFTDLNEVFKHFKQCNYAENAFIENSNITEELQIEILLFVHKLFLRKNDCEAHFCDRYMTVLTSDLREKNTVKNQALFNLATLFLKTLDGKYKPAQLCSIHELCNEFTSKLNCSNDFYYFLGLSSEPDLKVFDERINDRFKDGLDFIPAHIPYDGLQDPINMDVVKNCNISYREVAIHPALINDNYPELFPYIKKGNFKAIRGVTQALRVKRYDEYPREYFSKLLEYLIPYLTDRFYFQHIRNFYAQTFLLFNKNNKWLIYNGKAIEVASQKNFMILKNKIDVENAYYQNLKNFLIYDSEKGLFDDQELENLVVMPTEVASYDQESKTEITEKIKEVLSDKLVYILCNITRDKHSERDYLNNDYSVLESISRTKFYVVKNFKISRISEFVKYDYKERFKIEGDHVFLADEMEQTVSLVISEWLFATHRFAEKIEIILYHRDLDDLVKEYDSSEINLYKQKYDHSYFAKEELFLNEIKGKFPEIMLEEHKWNYEGSSSLIKIDENGRRKELVDFLEELRYSDIFKDFHFGYHIIDSKGALEKKNVKEDNSREDEVNYLVRKLSNFINNKNIVKSVNYKESPVNASGPSLKKKNILNYQSEKQTNDSLEVIGSNGEHEVLQYYINKFFDLSAIEKKDVVEKVYYFIKDIVQDIPYYENLKEKILENLDSATIIEMIIPFFYITNKYKYSYFDMIGFNDGKVFPVEVKTTSSIRSDFFISSAEIECALRYPDYQVVRVTPNDITFLGNPILSFKDQLQGYQNKSYKLVSTKYKIYLLQ